MNQLPNTIQKNNNMKTEDLNDFDPMSESSFKPEIVSKKRYEEIKSNGEIVRNFYTNNPKYRDMLNKHGEIFEVNLRSSADWTKEDSELYEEWLTEKEKLPIDWNITEYAIEEKKTIQTSEEIIKEAKETFKTDYPEGCTYISEAHYIIGWLKQHYDTLLKSISEDTRDKFISSSDAPTYEEMIEQHEGFESDEDAKKVAKNISDNLFNTIAQITKDHAKNNYNINL